MKVIWKMMIFLLQPVAEEQKDCNNFVYYYRKWPWYN